MVDLGGTIVSIAGFLVGGVVGGLAFWTLGYQAVVVRSAPDSILWNLAFLVSVLAFVFAILSPFALALFVGRGRSGVRSDLTSLAGYVAAFAFVVGLGLLGVFVLEDLGIDSAAKGIAFLDAVFGFTFGGIGGSLLASRWVRRR